VTKWMRGRAAAVMESSVSMACTRAVTLSA
jgi:hypothetical protein